MCRPPSWTRIESDDKTFADRGVLLSLLRISVTNTLCVKRRPESQWPLPRSDEFCAPGGATPQSRRERSRTRHGCRCIIHIFTRRRHGTGVVSTLDLSSHTLPTSDIHCWRAIYISDTPYSMSAKVDTDTEYGYGMQNVPQERVCKCRTGVKNAEALNTYRKL